MIFKKEKYNYFKWCILSILYVPFLYLAYLSYRDWAPGLLDDGTHLWLGKLYCSTGFFPQIAYNMSELFRVGARFYELHYNYLGVLTCLFGKNFGFWYLTNFTILLFTSVIIFKLVSRYTSNFWASAVAALLVIYNSSVIETAGANFGKVEIMQGLLLAISLYLLPLEYFFGKIDTIKKKDVKFWLLFIVLTLFALSKESSKLVLLLLLGSYCLVWIARPFDRTKKDLQKSMLALFLALAVNFVVFLFSLKSQYLNSYFALDFSKTHLNDSWEYYKRYTNDIYNLSLLSLVLVFVNASKLKFKKIPPSYTYIFLVPALSMYGLLLAFRFQTTYYMYLVILLVSAQVGLVLGFAIQKKYWFQSAIIFIVFIWTKGFVLPNMLASRTAQSIFDMVNSQAMKDTKGSKIVFFDTDESSQLIQEWNILETNFYGNETTKAFGLYSGFKAMNFQNMVRGIKDQDQFHWSKWVDAQYLNEYRNIYPSGGDIFVKRRGKFLVEAVSIRGGAPMEINDGQLFVVPEGDLEKISEYDMQKTVVRPYDFHKVDVSYGYSLYKLRDDFRFYVVGLGYDNSFSKGLRIITTSNLGKCRKVILSIRTSSPDRSLRLSMDKLSFVSQTNSNSVADFEIPLNPDSMSELNFVVESTGDPLENSAISQLKCL